MKQGATGALIFAAIYPALILTLPAVLLTVWLFLAGPFVYHQAELQLANWLWFPITGRSCIYPFLTAWAGRRAWLLYREGHYLRAVYISLIPWLIVAFVVMMIWLQEATINSYTHPVR